MFKIFLLTFSIAACNAAGIGYTYNAAPSTGFISISQQPTFSGSAIASPSITPVIHSQPQQTFHAPTVTNEVQKEFYTFTAPAEEFDVPQAEQEISHSNKKNVQVIFIHAPETSGYNRVVQNLAQQTLEQQTAIYVLTKQPDVNQLAQSFRTNINRVAHKPEVHFVKYRTQQDAAQAQQSIRAQYDSIGGSSSNLDGGVARVLNFASSQPSVVYQGGHGSQGSSQQSQPIQVPSQSYLPVSY